MCIFCDKSKIDTGLPKNTSAYSIYDQFPVSPLHMLVIPKRHCESCFDMTKFEWNDCFELVRNVCNFLRHKDPKITGFNIGLNDGQSAGQTVMHSHIHVIPRYDGDMEDPRGGVRHCIIGRGYY